MMHERAPGVFVDPVDMEFEAACEHLTGKRRRGESRLEWVRRGLRIRELLRAEQTLRRMTAPTSTPAGRCAHAGTHLPTGDSQ